MEMKDPAPGAPWRPDQFWVCPRCSRHFWTTYVAPPAKETAKEPPKPPTETPSA
jgi:hypothetical protein